MMQGEAGYMVAARRAAISLRQLSTRVVEARARRLYHLAALTMSEGWQPAHLAVRAMICSDNAKPFRPVRTPAPGVDGSPVAIDCVSSKLLGALCGVPQRSDADGLQGEGSYATLSQRQEDFISASWRFPLSDGLGVSVARSPLASMTRGPA